MKGVKLREVVSQAYLGSESEEDELPEQQKLSSNDRYRQLLTGAATAGKITAELDKASHFEESIQLCHLLTIACSETKTQCMLPTVVTESRMRGLKLLLMPYCMS